MNIDLSMTSSMQTYRWTGHVQKINQLISLMGSDSYALDCLNKAVATIPNDVPVYLQKQNLADV